MPFSTILFFMYNNDIVRSKFFYAQAVHTHLIVFLIRIHYKCQLLWKHIFI